MAFNLIDSINGLLGNDFVSKASNQLNEDQNKVQNAMSGVIPSVLAGILNKAGSGDAANVLKLAKDTANGGMLSNLGGFLGNNSLLSKGSELVKGLFGDRTSDVANTISNFFGIKSTSAASLMSVVAPAALGSIGRHAEASNMGTGGFLSFLNNQKDSILNALPSGLNLAGALGLSSLGSIGSKLSGAISSLSGQVKDMPGQVVKTTSGSRWLVPAILAIAAIGLLWYFLSGKKTPVDTTQAVKTEAAPEPVIAAPPPAIESIKVRLPNGVEIDAYKGGIEDQLVRFLNDPTSKIDKNTWFDFDNLNFETGSANITPESMRQVENIATILKAFPKASLKIGGYTDKTGDEPANVKLSQARAEAVVAVLKSNGIGKAQLDGAEGYGSQFAKVPAEATDEERRKDRRIAVSPRKK